MVKISGIIQLKFKEGIDFGKVQETINNIYLKNRNIIYGMEYNQFDKEETLIELNRKIKEWCKYNREIKG